MRNAPSSQGEADRLAGESSLISVLLAVALRGPPEAEQPHDPCTELLSLARVLSRPHAPMEREDPMEERARVTYLRPDDLQTMNEELDDHERRLRRLERRSGGRLPEVDLRGKDLLQLVLVAYVAKRILR